MWHVDARWRGLHCWLGSSYMIDAQLFALALALTLDRTTFETSCGRSLPFPPPPQTTLTPSSCGLLRRYAFHKEAAGGQDEPGQRKARLLKLFGHWNYNVRGGVYRRREKLMHAGSALHMSLLPIT